MDKTLRSLLERIDAEGRSLTPEDAEQLYARAAWTLAAHPGQNELAGFIDTYSAAGAWSEITQSGRGEHIAYRAVSDDQVRAMLERAADAGMRLLTPEHHSWPQQLRRLEPLSGAAPLALWCLGDLKLLERTIVTVTGSRASYGTGEATAAKIAGDVARAGHVVLAGLGYGIEAAAHAAALSTGKPTIALMPCGIDVTYPAAHDRLLRQIIQQGLVLSEVAPGVGPLRPLFGHRAWLYASLAHATVVVAANLRSAALRVAEIASDLDRPVFAVPGETHNAHRHEGTHHLIRCGTAAAFTTVDQINRAIG